MRARYFASLPRVTVLRIFSVHRLGRSALRDDILSLAGRPGDRWASLRKKAGREESPDTVVYVLCV